MKSNVIQTGENQIRIDKIEKCQVGSVQLQHKKNTKQPLEKVQNHIIFISYPFELLTKNKTGFRISSN